MIHNLLPHVRLLPGIPVAVVVHPHARMMAAAGKDAPLRPAADLPGLIEMKYRERVVLVASAYRDQAQRQQAKRPMRVPSVLLAQASIVSG